MGVPIFDGDNVIPMNKCKAESRKELEPKTSKPKPPKDFIGSGKEFRIDCNRNNLRIIGNGNKIRINRNSGNLDIVGNGTRVKILNNSGAIKYTGNSGRIYLGSESPEQAIDYIGCNGILKVLNAADIRSNSDGETDRQEKRKSLSPSPATRYNLSSPKSDTESERNSSPLPLFNRFSVRSNISLPNAVHPNCHPKSARITNCFNLSCSTGNIVIKNAISVSI
ncbi:uncharacterized protein LOC129952272 [Eupeodes corollae]|uniref:uncharacterized protein LOC129952272 n=1 Tax=Eupeodes corollae TaxID=290404 RepID=UPI002492000B|nr:uncharacterized protein LOC129952272 [Eupeodes corollae]